MARLRRAHDQPEDCSRRLPPTGDGDAQGSAFKEARDGEGIATSSFSTIQLSARCCGVSDTVRCCGVGVRASSAAFASLARNRASDALLWKMPPSPADLRGDAALSAASVWRPGRKASVERSSSAWSVAGLTPLGPRRRAACACACAGLTPLARSGVSAWRGSATPEVLERLTRKDSGPPRKGHGGSDGGPTMARTASTVTTVDLVPDPPTPALPRFDGTAAPSVVRHAPKPSAARLPRRLIWLPTLDFVLSGSWLRLGSESTSASELGLGLGLGLGSGLG